MDLDQLAREIAATSDAWMVPGVRILLDGHRAARVVMPGRIWVEETGQHLSYEPYAGDIPDLRDPVTVNSLLGDGEVVDYWGKGKDWIVNHTPAIYPSRTEAIARAWIAAHKGDK